MTSKSLFFKLMREDLKRRIWAVALIGLGCFFVFPVMTAFMAGNIKEYEIYARGLAVYTDDLVELFSFGNVFTAFGMTICALICGLSGFSYLNSRSKVDFYHGIPVRREKLYAANYLNGILMVTVPYGIFLVLAVIIGISNGVSQSLLWSVALTGYILHVIYYILMYAVVVIATMMTGNLVVGFLGCMVFAFAFPLAVSLIQGYFVLFYTTYVSERVSPLYQWGIRISPIMEYMCQIESYNEGRTVFPAALGALAVSALLAVLGCFLYRRRPSEAAGKAMAFKISCPFICIMLTMISALGLGAFFWGIRNSMAWAVFGLLCGAVICHAVIQIIYHFDFKKLFACKWQLGGCIVVSLAVLCVFRYDLTGYDSYLPDSGSVKSTAIDVQRLDNWVSYGEVYQNQDGIWRWDSQSSYEYVMENMKYQDVENTLQIAEAGIRQIEENELNKQQYGYDFVDGRRNVSLAEADPADGKEKAVEHWTEVIVRYTLNSGRKVYRKYHLCMQDIQPQIGKLMSDPQFLQGAYPVMNRTADRVSVVRYREGSQETVLDTLTMVQKEALLAAYQEEFAGLTMDQLYEEAPVGLICFSSEEEEAEIRWVKDREKKEDEELRLYGYYRRDSYDRYGRNYGYYSNAETRDYYPLYPSFTKTLELLKAQQIDAGSYFKNQKVQSVQVVDYQSEADGEYWMDKRLEATFVDPEEIAELMEVLEDGRRLYYNPLFLQSDLDVTLNIAENGEVYNYDVAFPKGKVPAFVTERLEKIN